MEGVYQFWNRVYLKDSYKLRAWGESELYVTTLRIYFESVLFE